MHSASFTSADDYHQRQALKLVKLQICLAGHYLLHGISGTDTWPSMVPAGLLLELLTLSCIWFSSR